MQRIYISSKGNIYEAILNKNWKELDSLTTDTLSEVLAYRAFWTLGIALFGLLIVGIINKLYKVEKLNSILLFLIIIGLLFSGFFLSGITNNYLNYFCAIFSKSYGLSFFIGGIIITLIGITILWKTISINKNSF